MKKFVIFRKLLSLLLALVLCVAPLAGCGGGGNTQGGTGTGGGETQGGGGTGGGTGGGGGYIDDIYSHIWIGTEPPENSNMIWVDTNTDGVVESEDDMGLLRMALEKITEMQNELNSLRRRVKYLEEHGTFDPDAGGDETPDDSDDIILLEDGTPLGLEDGSGDILMEIQTEKPSEEEVNNAVLLEDGTYLLYEDGSKILLEM